MKKQPKFYCVYIITNIISNKQYVGSHVCYKENDNYWCSSKTIKKECLIFGDIFTKEILKDDYQNKFDMLNDETKYILEYNTLAPNGYNRVLPTNHLKFHMDGCEHSKETRLKISKANKGKKKPPRTEEHKKNMSIAAKGKPKSKEHKEKIKKTMKGMNSGIDNIMYGKSTYILWVENFGIEYAENRMKEYRKLKSDVMKGKNVGKKRSEEIKQKLKNIPKLLCYHCNRYIDPGNYKQWHGQRCKYAKNEVNI